MYRCWIFFSFRAVCCAQLDEREYSVSGHFSPSSPSTLIAQLLDSTHTASVSFNPAASSTLSASPSSSDVDVFLDGEQYRFVLPRLSFTRTSVVGSGCVSPMAGRVVKVAVQAGQSVKKGAQLLVMEAMKMEVRRTTHSNTATHTTNAMLSTLSQTHSHYAPALSSVDST